MPLAVLLIPYGLLIALFVVFSVVNLYHVIRFGSMTFFSFLVTFLYLAATVLVLFGTITLLAGVDWTYPLIETGPNAPSLGI